LENLTGRIVLIEVGPVDLTGTVCEVGDGWITVGCDQDCWDSGDRRQVSMTIFSPEALFRFSSSAAVVAPRTLELGDGMQVEVVQRRRWPRRPLDLPVMLCPVVGGARVEGVPGRTVDVGIGGVCVETLRQVEGEGDPMIILSLPDGTTIVAGTMTVDTEELGDGWRYRLAFDHIDANDAGRLAEFTAV
jgi:hypothetical protein